MKLFISALLLHAAAVTGKSVELDPKTFDDAIHNKNVFAKFYAPWCGHCKALAPDWDSLADKYSGSSSVVIGSVDCTTDENDSLCQMYGVQGYPTLKYFKDGNTEGEDYELGRSYDELETFVEETLNTKKCIVGSDEEMAKEVSLLHKLPLAMKLFVLLAGLSAVAEAFMHQPALRPMQSKLAASKVAVAPTMSLETSAVAQVSQTLAGVVAVDGGTIGLDVSFAAFLAVILGLFIPVVFLVTLYIQSAAQGTDSTFRMPDKSPGVTGDLFEEM